jgi:protein phosphatase PTC1
MEDAHALVPGFFETHPELTGFFGIFDGHAGKQAALWCGENLPVLVKTKLNEDGTKSVTEALCKALVATDEELVPAKGFNSGCTAAVAVLAPDNSLFSTGKPRPDEKSDNVRIRLHTANVGDARVILSRGGTAYRLTHDHKGSDPQEIKRIIEAGGFMMNHRVNGVLAVTRSLGDSSMKDLIVSQPYTTETILTPNDEFLIIACDGVWDVMTDQEAVDLVYFVQDPQEASEMLVKHALDNNSMDNLSCMVIRFQH